MLKEKSSETTRETSSDNSALGNKSSSESDSPEARHGLAILPVAPADLPALVEAELLSFAGTAAPDALARRIHPFRADLVRARIPLWRWPDFASSLRRRERALKDEGNIMIKAEVTSLSKGVTNEGTNQDPKVAIGMAWLRLPESRLPNSLQTNPWKFAETFSRTHLRPARERMETAITTTEPDGTDLTFFDIFKAEVLRARKVVEKQLLRGAPYASLEIIYVHPAHRGSGAGVALLSDCIRILESTSINGKYYGLPILLESTGTATPLYVRFGFREVYRSRVEYGGETYEWPVMLREPSKTKQ